MRALHLFAAAAVLLPLAVASQTPAPAKPAMPANHPPISGSPHAKAPPSPWAELADYTLTVKAPPKGEAGTWKFQAFENPTDAMIEIDTPGAKGRIKGSLMLVGGNVFAVKGLTLEPRFELDPLDVAVLNFKMATRLLELAMPGGPAALKGKQPVNARDEKMPVLVSTPTGNAKFEAPWSLRGNVERLDAATVAFQLEVEAAGAKSNERVRWSFAGKASGSPKGRVLPDTTSLAGYTAYRMGSGSSSKSGHTTLQFVATKLPGPYATVKDLRAAK